jgi:ABC-type transporter Mla subunit MlaD
MNSMNEARLQRLREKLIDPGTLPRLHAARSAMSKASEKAKSAEVAWHNSGGDSALVEAREEAKAAAAKRRSDVSRIQQNVNAKLKSGLPDLADLADEAAAAAAALASLMREIENHGSSCGALPKNGTVLREWTAADASARMLKALAADLRKAAP